MDHEKRSKTRKRKREERKFSTFRIGKKYAIDYQPHFDVDELRKVRSRPAREWDMRPIFSISDVPGFGVKNPPDLRCCLNFLIHIPKCQAWLKSRVRELGWETNPVQYDPVTVSFSLTELVEETYETYLMLLKLTSLFWAEDRPSRPDDACISVDA